MSCCTGCRGLTLGTDLYSFNWTFSGASHKLQWLLSAENPEFIISLTSQRSSSEKRRAKRMHAACGKETPISPATQEVQYHRCNPDREQRWCEIVGDILLQTELSHGAIFERHGGAS
jgi:hypothetical protein